MRPWAFVLGLGLIIAPGCAARRAAPAAPVGTADSRWADVDWRGGVVLWGTFTRDELEHIAAVVAIETAGYSRRDRRLYSVKRREEDGRIEVHTGRMCGILCGGGYMYVLEQLDGSWIVAESYTWES
jgi:hypothetical protein